ncbi:hypothetical protein D3C71_1536010 [compost metagenome]
MDRILPPAPTVTEFAPEPPSSHRPMPFGSPVVVWSRPSKVREMGDAWDVLPSLWANTPTGLAPYTSSLPLEPCAKVMLPALPPPPAEWLYSDPAKLPWAVPPKPPPSAIGCMMMPTLLAPRVWISALPTLSVMSPPVARFAPALDWPPPSHPSCSGKPGSPAIPPPPPMDCSTMPCAAVPWVWIS